MDKLKNLKLDLIFNKGNSLFIIGLAGIILIFASDFIFKENGSNSQKSTTDNQTTTQYISNLESRLEKLIANVDGAGKVQVMITLESDRESIYAIDETHSSMQENDEYKLQHVIIDGNNGNEALIKTVTEPEIKGAAIVCEGADDISVQKRIIDLVSVVLGLSTNRICVTKMNN